MDYFKILNRAFQITLNYRALWIFGILLALTTGGSSERGGGPGGGSARAASAFWNIPNPRTVWAPGMAMQVYEVLSPFIFTALCIGLVVAVLFMVLRYISETALIRMVDLSEATGETQPNRQGWRLGWSRPAFRIFLIDLLFGLGVLAIVLILLALAVIPLVALLTDVEAIRTIGVIMTAGLALLVILLVIALAIVLSLVLQVIRRACVLEDLGVFEAISRGFTVMRKRLVDVILMGLLLFAAVLVVSLLMIPLVMLLLLVGAIAGGLPGLLAYWIAGQFAAAEAPVIIGILVAAPIFLAVIIVPVLFISGLVEVFKSSAWTLTYRELSPSAASASSPRMMTSGNPE
jgi:hypothetical protein